MEDLPVEMLEEILSYLKIKEFSGVCTLWREIGLRRREREYIEKMILYTGESREWCLAQYRDYLENW
jgi:hypothetical protein